MPGTVPYARARHRVSTGVSQNGYVESFNGKLRDELLDREIFCALLEAKVLIDNSDLEVHSAITLQEAAEKVRELVH